jgi:hypothetical protein
MALVQARAARYSDTAGLFQALGGGWWNRDPQGNPSPAKRADCHPPKNPPRPQPWPDARPLVTSQPATGPTAGQTNPYPVSPQAQPSTPAPAPQASKGSWGRRFW